MTRLFWGVRWPAVDFAILFGADYAAAGYARRIALVSLLRISERGFGG
jgi:hypothetical protein